MAKVARFPDVLDPESMKEASDLESSNRRNEEQRLAKATNPQVKKEAPPQANKEKERELLKLSRNLKRLEKKIKNLKLG